MQVMRDGDVIWAQQILDKVRRTRGSYARTNPNYVEEVDRRNVQIYLRLRKEEKRREFLQSLPSEEKRAALDALNRLEEFKKATAEELAEKRPPETLNAEVVTLNKEIAEYFAKHPERLHDLTPRKFEEVIAAILRAMGAEVKITPQSRDGGRDILAVFKTGIGDMLTIVECKKYRIDRCVGVGLVERFMFVLNEKDKASCGLIATTSYFSPEVHALAQEYPFRLKLRDLKGIHEWVSGYGEWVKDGRSELWRPHF